MNKPIFFCHLPKTGGTTVRLALEKQFAPREIVPDMKMMSQNKGRYSPVADVERALRNRKGSVKLLRGHYHYSIRGWLDDSIGIVVLREPVARTISELKHHIAHGNLTVERLHKVLEAGRLPIPDNMMTRFLGRTLFNGEDTPLNERHRNLLREPIVDADRVLKSAMDAVDTVDVLGVTEALPEFAEDLEHRTGIVLGDGRFNVSRGVSLQLDDKQMATIREHNRLDFELYSYAQKRRRRLWKRIYSMARSVGKGRAQSPRQASKETSMSGGSGLK